MGPVVRSCMDANPAADDSAGQDGPSSSSSPSATTSPVAGGGAAVSRRVREAAGPPRRRRSGAGGQRANGALARAHVARWCASRSRARAARRRRGRRRSSLTRSSRQGESNGERPSETGGKVWSRAHAANRTTGRFPGGRHPRKWDGARRGRWFGRVLRNWDANHCCANQAVQMACHYGRARIHQRGRLVVARSAAGG